MPKIKEKKQNVKRIRTAKEIIEEVEHLKKLEKEKRLLLWSGVAFFMTVILVFWVINLKQVFKETASAPKNEEGMDWSKISEDFSKTMQEAKQAIGDLKAPVEMEIATSSLGIATSTSEIDELKKRLEKLEEKAQ